MQNTRETIIILVVTTTIIILLLTLIFVSLLHYYQRRRLIYLNNLQRIRTEYEKNLLNTQLEVQEETLHHISREIHDNIGLSLTLAKLNLNTIDDNIEEKSALKIGESASLIGKAISDLSGISHSLNSSMIKNNGLIKALEEEITRINKTGHLAARVEVTGNSVFLSDQKELFLFRIAQEALHNVVKYAHAHNAIVRLHYDSAELQMVIADDGIGFPKNKKNGDGSGIINMRSRAELLNGHLEVHTSTKGTSIEIIIPIN